MSDRTAYLVFLAVVCVGLALVTAAALAVAVTLWRRGRDKGPR